MKAERTLLFDLDGTLCDNYVGIAASIRYALARLDCPIPSDAALRSCVGPPLRETFASLLGTRDRELIESAVALYRERYAATGWQENVVYEGIEDLLAALATSGDRLFLCTAKPEIFARRIVAHFRIDRHFDGVYGAHLGAAFDDKTALLRHAIETEHIDSRAAIMIGDRAHDVRAAHANDLRAIGILWGYGSREELIDADSLVATPAELALLLNGEPQSRSAVQSSEYL